LLDVRSLAEVLQQATWNKRETALSSVVLSSDRLAPATRLPRLVSQRETLGSETISESKRPAAAGNAIVVESKALSETADPLATSVHRVVIDGREFRFEGKRSALRLPRLPVADDGPALARRG
jgi:hypothetical protein